MPAAQPRRSRDSQLCWTASGPIDFILWLSRPFGVTESYFDQPTLAALGRQFPRTRVEEMYGGMLFIATAPASEPDPSSFFEPATV